MISNSENLLWHLWLTDNFASALVAPIGDLRGRDGLMTKFWEDFASALVAPLEIFWEAS